MYDSEPDWDKLEEAMEAKRLAATDGHIQRLLRGSHIPSDSREAIESNYRAILRQPYLRTDVECYSLAIRALAAAPDDAFSTKLLRKLQRCRSIKRCGLLICPICRHDYRLDIRDEALSDIDESEHNWCYAVTIVHGVGQPDGSGTELVEMGEAIKDAKRYLRQLMHSPVGRDKRFRVIGAFEMDLYTYDELTTMTRKARTVDSMAKRTSDVAVVLTSHLLVRFRSHPKLMEHLNKNFYHPFQISVKRLSNRQDLRSHIKRVVQYPTKMGNLTETKNHERTAFELSTKVPIQTVTLCMAA